MKSQFSKQSTVDPSSMDGFNLATYLAQKKAFIDEHLKRRLAALPDTLHIKPPMAYSLMAGGKRLRPILCMAAAQAVGEPEKILPSAVVDTACAIELIHTYSLIHDDLPAMDDDNLRRGRPTCHLAFSEAAAILAGDALLTLAFHILATARPGESTSLEKRLSALSSLARAAGPQGMVEGQMRDLEAEGHDISLEQLKALHGLKTGALIRVSLTAGAELGGASAAQRECLGEYGQAIGLAYQVADDILNVEGDPRKLGKAIGTDTQRHKNTYPSLMGLAESKVYAQSLVEDALHALGAFDKRADPLRAVAHYVIARGH
jgi:geranylgeranyl diphosphate synthase type II